MQFSSRAPFTCKADYLNPKLWRMLFDIVKFTNYLMKRPEVKEGTTAEWVKEAHFAPEFYRHYFIPFVSILWTVPYEDVMKLPATQFLRCLCTHAQSLYVSPLQVALGAFGQRVEGPRHKWWYMGSAYKPAFLKIFEESGLGTVHLNSKVKSVSQGSGPKTVTFTDGSTKEFDHVILACHPDASLNIIPWSKGCKNLEVATTCFWFDRTFLIFVHYRNTSSTNRLSTCTGTSITCRRARSSGQAGTSVSCRTTATFW